MGKKMGRNSEIVCLMWLIIILMVLGCGTQQAPPPVAPPRAETAQTSRTTTPSVAASQPVAPPPAGTVQTLPAATPFVATSQPVAPPPAGTVQTLPAATPSQDFNQLQLGMTSEQAQQIMGVPRETKQGKTVTRWFYSRPQGKVEVRIKNNQVVALELE